MVKPKLNDTHKSRSQKKSTVIPGLYYNQGYLHNAAKDQLKKELAAYHPIWESRYALNHPPPEGDTWRDLKRPVYWLGNWQFACLGYFHPPHNVHYACAGAEEFPPLLSAMARDIERKTRKMAHPSDIPAKWHLNTCLINYYGSHRIMDDETKKEQFVDVAVVGDHRDAEPGPVASVSLGERAWFQFVKGKAHDKSNVVYDQWLGDGSLLIFWGKTLKDELFHRVPRVENRQDFDFEDHLENYRTRRINLTLRYVPEEFIKSYQLFPQEKIADTLPYVSQLSQFSSFWAQVQKQVQEKVK